jgi:hypothetical protein
MSVSDYEQMVKRHERCPRITVTDDNDDGDEITFVMDNGYLRMIPRVLTEVVINKNKAMALRTFLDMYIKKAVK